MTVAGGTSNAYYTPAFGFSYAGKPDILPALIYVRPSTKSGADNGTAVFQADAGHPIQFSVTTFGDVSGSQYDVYVVLEQL